jgi:hypothetical protein
MVTTAAGAGSTWTMSAIQADNAALTTNVNTVISATYAAATLTAGYAFELMFPNKSINQLFLGFSCSGSGGTTTVSLDVYLVPSDEIPAYRSFVKVVNANV